MQYIVNNLTTFLRYFRMKLAYSGQKHSPEYASSVSE